MHTITISDEVMKEIQTLCLIKGQSEDCVLRRLLGCPEIETKTDKEDFYDTTYGIRFPKGFIIFRVYKGRIYSARVSNGHWMLDGNNHATRTFNSLNQLSQSIIDGNENAWKFWYYHNKFGETRCISDLRDPKMIQRRPRRKFSFKNKERASEEVSTPTVRSNKLDPRESFKTNANYRESTTNVPIKKNIITKDIKPWKSD